MVTFSNTEKSITSIDIDEIETYIGLKFPEEYRKHLLKFNGGQCTPNVFHFLEKGKPSSSCIDWFLAIYEGENDNLKDYIDILKKDEKRMPTHIVPIAHDPGGNQICLSCGIQDYGYVYFWDHENEVDYTISGDDNYSNLYLIAKNFNEFLEGLTPLEE
jgi:cell wall assembly regulator SMI1